MKIVVCVKHAIDETELRLDSSGKPVLEGAPTKMSTFDKNALEEAIRMRSAIDGEITIIIVGPADAKKTMKEGLAMGADKGILVTADPRDLDSFGIAGLLAAAIRKTGPFDIIICSEGSSDVYTGQVPPMLGEMLGLPYVGYARKIEVTGKTVNVERSLEDSVEAVEAPTPLVVSVVSEINEPRYPTLIQIMQASKKPTEEWPAAQLVPQHAALVQVLGMDATQVERKRVIFEGTAEEAAAKLVSALTADGVIST